MSLLVACSNEITQEVDRRYIPFRTEWGCEAHISVTRYSTFDSVRCSIRNSSFEQVIMAGSPGTGGVVIGGYNFYIDGKFLPRFYESVTLVWPVLNQRLEIDTHCGGNREPGVERDLRVHIPNPEFAGETITVAVVRADTLMDVRTKLVGVIVERMFYGDYVFRVGGEIIPRHKERDRLAWPIFCDILALVPCRVLEANTPEGMYFITCGIKSMSFIQTCY